MHNLTRRSAALGASLLALGMLSGCGSPTPSASTAAAPSAAPSTAAQPTKTPAVPTPAASAATPTPTPSTPAGPCGKVQAPTTPAATAVPTGTPTIGTSLDVLQVSGAPLSLPTVKVPAPWGIKQTQVKVLKQGTGAVVNQSAVTTVCYLGVLGRTGEIFDSNYGAPQAASFSVDFVVPGFSKALVGQKVGSRVLVAMPPEDGYGDSPREGGKIKPGDHLIFVMDILSATPGHATGAYTAPTGAVKVSADAVPKVIVPAGTKVGATTTATTVIKGKGVPVQPTDAVFVHYQQYSAATGKLITSTFGKKSEAGMLNSLVPGWQKLVGHTVDSRVLLLVPKGEDQGKEDMVYVVDILNTQAGQ